MEPCTCITRSAALCKEHSHAHALGTYVRGAKACACFLMLGESTPHPHLIAALLCADRYPMTRGRYDALINVNAVSEDEVRAKTPNSIQVALANYVENGNRPGSFIEAVLADDKAVARAHEDAQNFCEDTRHAISTYVLFVVPRALRGSWAAVRSHMSCAY